ncbi:MAG TPA: peptide chain release factor N(5)-glutamine methyltransferase [Rhizobiaceae bacterium]|nr:peptide chain release factor N(5)-glutamine methyltransferase [Rhizobiaceae bacterium]
MTTVADLMARGEAVLAQAGIAQPRLDARLLLQHVLGVDHAGLISRFDRPADGKAAAFFEASIARRSGGEPVSRIRGEREFYGLPLRISPAVLDPRPETELLVDRVLADHPERTARDRFADIGTGSGAIALALLANLPAAAGVALDISTQALEVALENAQALGFDNRFEAVHSDYLAGATGKFHFIVSNPPYIPANEIGGLSREVREHDPLAALSGGGDGLDAYRAILSQAANHLAGSGRLYLELGSGQSGQVAVVARENHWVVCGVYQDLAAIERVMVLQRDVNHL